ncbi:MAG TPA: DEAD/DEAH box helicase, partial [Spirochaetota bacterium]|nr:DEAD/DEAH box helicase [Spirochaetota bacterium]
MGLGKTFISALFAQQLKGKILIICPPVLKDYWRETFFEFGIRSFVVESLGKLDHIIKDSRKYDYIFIDESHRFRNELTEGYEQLHQICFGKKIILVSATPLNNSIDDIYSQLKLFQIPKKCTIPGVPDLEKFFATLRTKLAAFKKTDPEYIEIVKVTSKEVREKILKYIMVRRTRGEIKRYFIQDLKNQGLTFPEIAEPKRIIYKFDEETNSVFKKTIELLKKFSYSRYSPLLYSKEQLSEFELQSQRNIGGFMKGLIVKRLESSFYAFKKTLERFCKSYEKFIEMFKKGTVYISKKIDIYEYLDSDNEEFLLDLIEKDDERIKSYNVNKFEDNFIIKLEEDYEILKQIKKLWSDVLNDPKIEQFLKELKTDSILKDNKLIIFTESKETGEYLYRNLYKNYKDAVLFYCSNGATYQNQFFGINTGRDLINDNFNPNKNSIKNNIQILITTDVLAEGINLHRSNIILNYDLPWNPTRVLQRVGRVNRVGTSFSDIYIYNFFPTSVTDEHLGLEVSIKSKIQSFHDTLGEDSKYLSTDEIVVSHELFGDNLYKKLNDKNSFQSEDDDFSELEYLKIIRDIRDNKPDLFEEIKKLPKKTRSCRKFELIEKDSLLTFFRKGMLKKFVLSSGNISAELNFLEAIKFFQCDEKEDKKQMPEKYYDLLEHNKKMFYNMTNFNDVERVTSKGSSNTGYIIKRLKAVISENKVRQPFIQNKLSDDEEDFLKECLRIFEEGIVTDKTAQKLKRELEN